MIGIFDHILRDNHGIAHPLSPLPHHPNHFVIDLNLAMSSVTKNPISWKVQIYRLWQASNSSEIVCVLRE